MARVELLDVESDLERLASQLVRKTAVDIQARARIAAPVDTGFLRQSIEPSFPSPLEALVAVGAEYGIYQELGTRFIPPNPFLGPAAEAVRVDFERAVKLAFGA